MAQGSASFSIRSGRASILLFSFVWEDGFPLFPDKFQGASGMNDGGMLAAAGGKFERGYFKGNASEYFGIWIVNVLLTILTAGIYSAWAKVRRKRYFNGSTVLHGRTFGYHATGKQIFLGRLVSLVFIIGANAVTLVPFLAFLPLLLLILVLPWVVQRSLRFNARVTSYRNVRFDFKGGAGGAFVAVVAGGFLAFISLGILAPLATRWVSRYIFGNLYYGDRPFSADPKLGSLYRVWIIPALMVAVGGILSGILIAVYIAAVRSMDIPQEKHMYVGQLLLSIGFFCTMIVYGLAGIIYRAGVRNVVLSAMVLDGKHQLKSDIHRGRYLWIVMSNLILTLLTLGLMRPWAAVREARYLVEHSAIKIDGDIGEVFSSVEAKGAAISAEYMDMEGIEFGI
jgi:uncharacterized membrane protein YjgN (DUF898 family)